MSVAAVTLPEINQVIFELFNESMSLPSHIPGSIRSRLTGPPSKSSLDNLLVAAFFGFTVLVESS